MNHFSIIPGALPSIHQSDELRYKEISAKRIDDLPSVGGVGKIPLIIHHQHNLPSCTGEAGAYCRMITHYLQTGKMVNLSPMFIYKMNRLFDGLPHETKGSTLKATVQTLQAKGVCKEKLYPSTKENCESKFPSIKQGAKLLLADAAQYKIKKYARCDDLSDIISALADRRPVMFSLIIFSDFYTAQKGRIPAKISGEKIGGHSMVAMNYDLNREIIQVVQSWGDSPNGPTDRGYMYIPFSWFEMRLNGKVPLLIEAFTML